MITLHALLEIIIYLYKEREIEKKKRSGETEPENQ